jgi:pimeloyl-ACP methyl ester carboxylesterase
MTVMRVGPFELETIRRGSGQPVLLIHGVNPIHPASPFLTKLTDDAEVIAPSHPGFGATPRPADFDTMYDLVNLYSSILDTFPSGGVTVIGFSFGGWIAAELAVTNPARLGCLILVDPVGIKIGGREDRDIVHFFNTDPNELNQRSWHDPALRPAGIYGLGWQATISDAMNDQEMITLARNWDSLCLYGWSPHMFNPRLRHWLHRIAVPTQVIWGASDRIVTPDYGRSYAGFIPEAEFTIIPAAGHHPELEQPDEFMAAVSRFRRSVTGSHR